MREALHTRNMALVYDEDKRISYCTWGETTTHAETAMGFDWIVEVMNSLPPERSLRGTIIDFTQVVIFAEDSLWSDEVKPEQIHVLHQHQHLAMNRLPTAIVVKTLYQATYIGNTLRGYMLSDPSETVPRVKVVRSLEQAEAHITAWHAYYAEHPNLMSEN